MRPRPGQKAKMGNLGTMSAPSKPGPHYSPRRDVAQASCLSSQTQAGSLCYGSLRMIRASKSRPTTPWSTASCSRRASLGPLAAEPVGQQLDLLVSEDVLRWVVGGLGVGGHAVVSFAVEAFLRGVADDGDGPLS